MRVSRRELEDELVKLSLWSRASKTVSQVARENGVGAETGGMWSRWGFPSVLGCRWLEREVRELKLEREFLSTGRGLLREGASVSARSGFIHAPDGHQESRW